MGNQNLDDVTLVLLDPLLTLKPTPWLLEREGGEGGGERKGRGGMKGGEM